MRYFGKGNWYRPVRKVVQRAGGECAACEKSQNVPAMPAPARYSNNTKNETKEVIL